MPDLIRTVNPCYPRSGHRYLRAMCQRYLGDRMVFGTAHDVGTDPVSAANYIKDHDFGLLNVTPGIAPQPETQYLVQYRHPLESAQSYFEFQVHYGHLSDTRESWEDFLPKALTYWQAFAKKWCLDDTALGGRPVHRVAYGTLYSDTQDTLAGVLTFLTGGSEPVNPVRLNRVIEKSALDFVRYAEDQERGEKRIARVRDIRAFRYFDENLAAIEDALTTSYLTPLGLPRLLD